MFQYTQHTKQWVILRSAVARANNPMVQLQQLGLMQRQIQLMQDIEQQLKNRPLHFNTCVSGPQILLNNSQISWETTNSQLRARRYSSVNPYEQDQKQQEIAKALAQVKQNCSEGTYHAIQNKFFQTWHNKQHQLMKLLKRQISVNKEIKTKLLNLSQQNQTINKELEKAYMAIQLHQSDRQKLKKQTQELFMKERALIVSETKTFQKQKSLIDLKKRLEDHQKQMNRERKVIDELLKEIQQRIEYLQNGQADQSQNKSQYQNIDPREKRQSRQSSQIQKVQIQSRNLINYYRQILKVLRTCGNSESRRFTKQSQFSGTSSSSRYSLGPLYRQNSSVI